MKRLIITALFLLATAGLLIAQEDIVVTAVSEAGEGLDLQAVGELFAEAGTLEEFEEALNDEDTGVNNLDLDRDGFVDYIRVVEQVEDYTHIIILQVALGEYEYQDVATIEVEKIGDKYNLQVRGNADIYGPDYYYTPNVVYIRTWPIIYWIYRPYYRPYVSVWHWHYYPGWWVPRPWVTVNIYHTRIVHYHAKPRFYRTHTTCVHSVHKVNYTPRRSPRVARHTSVSTGNGRAVVKRSSSGTNTRKATARQRKQGTEVRSTTTIRVKRGNTVEQTRIKKRPSESSAGRRTVRKTPSESSASRKTVRKTRSVSSSSQSRAAGPGRPSASNAKSRSGSRSRK